MKRALFAALLLGSLLPGGCADRSEQGLTLLVGGDLLLDRGIARSLELYGPELLLAELGPLLEGADHTLVNLECPVATAGTPRDKRYVFRGDTTWLPQLRGMGITHLNLANNHTLDQGPEGFASTLKHLRRNGFGVAGLDSAGCRPLLLTQAGVRVALFATNRIEVASAFERMSPPRPCQVTPDSICSAVRHHLKQHPDHHVVVLLHWGREYGSEPSPRQREQARRLIDAGADAVLGHHPHVVQGWEEYRGRPIIYSLGNFLFDQLFPDTREGWLVRLVFQRRAGLSWTLHPFERDEFFGVHLLSQ